MTKFSKIAEFLEWAESQGIGFKLELYTRSGTPAVDGGRPIEQGAPPPAAKPEERNTGVRGGDCKWMKNRQSGEFNVSVPSDVRVQPGDVVKVMKRDGTGQQVKLVKSVGPAYGGATEWTWEKP